MAPSDQLALPEIIAHRRNTIALLDGTPRDHGVEVDIRSFGDRLIIHHDPFVDGLDFDAWIDRYAHGTLILNVKEEGLEERLLAIMESKGIARFFFLDQSFPFLLRTARRGERRCAVRVSEYESVETALALVDMVDWIWVDIFTDTPPEPRGLQRLKAAGFRLCLVSPELQGRTVEKEIPRLRDHFVQHQIVVDAVCTKNAAAWG